MRERTGSGPAIAVKAGKLLLKVLPYSDGGADSYNGEVLEIRTRYC
jgi:hypothetical protein